MGESLEGPRRKFEDNIKIDRRNTVCPGVGFI